MLVIGIAGGIACGKSAVAIEFQRLGAEILDADRVGHEVLRESEIVQAIRVEFGESVIVDGEVDRKAVARIVFSSENDAALRRLEAITHPVIGQRIQQRILQIRENASCPAVVLDAPVMFKAGWHQFCDKIVFVDVPVEIRKQRVRETRGWTDQELVDREARQFPLSEKRAKSTDVIYNSGTMKQLSENVLQLWSSWGLVAKQNLPC